MLCVRCIVFQGQPLSFDFYYVYELIQTRKMEKETHLSLMPNTSGRKKYTVFCKVMAQNLVARITAQFTGLAVRS